MFIIVRRLQSMNQAVTTKSESKQLEPKDGGTDHTVVWPSDTI